MGHRKNDPSHPGDGHGFDDVQKTFFDLPDQATKDTPFLIHLSSDFQSEDEMNRVVIDLISTYPKYLSKFALNSQVYAMARIKHRTRLFEIYQRCPHEQVTIRELALIPNNEIM